MKASYQDQNSSENACSEERSRGINFVSSDANICKQIEILRADIKKIGVNYNQVVKAVNTAVKLKGRNGQPVVSTRSMEYKLSGMKTLMEGILAKVCEIKEELS